MRTLTAIALAVSMLVGVTAAQATESTTHHSKKKHHSSSGQKGASDSKNSTKEKAPASK